MAKVENKLIIREAPKNLAEVFYLLIILPEDFLTEGKNDTPPQERESL